MNKKLPPVGCPVMVRDTDGTLVLCAVTHSPMRGHTRISPDDHRRIEVVGINDPAFRKGGIIHRDEYVYRGFRSAYPTTWYFEYEPTAEGAESTPETA